MPVGPVNSRSLRALGWPTPKTALTALTAGIIGSQMEVADAQASTCECGTDYPTVIYMVLSAAALAAAIYHLGRQRALAELHEHKWKRLETLMSTEVPKVSVEQDKSDVIPMPVETEAGEEGPWKPLQPSDWLGGGSVTSSRSQSSSTGSANSARSTHKVYCRCSQCCKSDEGGETTTRRIEGGQGSWSNHLRARRGRAPSYGQDGSERRPDSAACHPPARATTAALPPPPEMVWRV